MKQKTKQKRKGRKQLKAYIERQYVDNLVHKTPIKSVKDLEEQVQCEKQLRAEGRKTLRKSLKFLSTNEYIELLEIQQDRCAICRETFTTIPNIDHCHKTNKVRALLCSACNKGLGFFRDNIEFLQNAIQYLRTFQGINYKTHFEQPISHEPAVEMQPRSPELTSKGAAVVTA